MKKTSILVIAMLLGITDQVQATNIESLVLLDRAYQHKDYKEEDPKPKEKEIKLREYVDATHEDMSETKIFEIFDDPYDHEGHDIY